MCAGHAEDGCCTYKSNAKRVGDENDGDNHEAGCRRDDTISTVVLGWQTPPKPKRLPNSHLMSEDRARRLAFISC